MVLDINPKDIWDGKQPPNVMALYDRFRALGLNQWDNDKVLRTSQLLGVTLSELCGMAGLFDPRPISNYITKNHWPMNVALNFDRLRRIYLAVKLNQTMMPNAADIAIAKMLADPVPEKYDPFSYKIPQPETAGL